MVYLYLLLNLSSLLIPFLFSFHPKIQFYKYWKSLFPSILITMSVFIPWDIIFTQQGFWGFNTTYFLGIELFKLPIEEWLFFICIPYACVFTHYALLHYFPNTIFSVKHTKLISWLLIIVLFIGVIFSYNKWYTLINFSYAILLLILIYNLNFKLLQEYYFTFIIMLIPFFIVNGILTGSFIDNEVVWYNNSENLNIRLFTIPIEDTIYALTLILSNLFLMKVFQKKHIKKN